MSSKYIEKAWCFRTVSMEEKLLLIALAELSDRDGAFITSMTALKGMMCASENAIDNLLGKLSIEQILVGVNKRTAAYQSEGKIKGRLNFDTYISQQENKYNTPYNTRETAQNIFEQPKRLSNFQRSHVAPLNKSTSGKTINVNNLSANVVEGWAELIMFKSGYGGQTNIWASFIERLKETPDKQLYPFDELTSRLHSHIHAEKFYRQPKNASYSRPIQPTLKRSALEILEEKIANFTFKDDLEGDVNQ